MRHKDGSFMAWRAWRLKGIAERNPILHSLTRPLIWEGAVATSHNKPHKGFDDIGIHAWNLRPTAEDIYYKNLLWKDGIILGRVEIYGRVIECERGLLGEHALVSFLDLRFMPCIDVKGICWFCPYSRDKCKEKEAVAYWCETKKINNDLSVTQTRPYCPKHAIPYEFKMPINKVADMLMDRYQCEVRF